MIGGLIKGADLKTDLHTEALCGKEVRNLGDASTSQGVPRFGRKPPKFKRKSWNKFPPATRGKKQPAKILIVQFQS